MNCPDLDDMSHRDAYAGDFYDDEGDSHFNVLNKQNVNFNTQFNFGVYSSQIFGHCVNNFLNNVRKADTPFL